MAVIDINIHGCTFREYTDFAHAYGAGNSRKAMKLAHKFILRWDFDQPLDAEDAVLKLKVGQAAAVVRTLIEAFDKLFDEAKITEVEVDFDAWNMDRFALFDELRQARKVGEYEPMLHEVAKAKGVKPNEPLSIYNGILFMKAVTEKSKKIFSGGN
jgi:hypothetical protein